MRCQGKALIFLTVRDGTGYMQCVLHGALCQVYNALILSTESSVIMYGKLEAVPEGQTVRKDLIYICDRYFAIIVYKIHCIYSTIHINYCYLLLSNYYSIAARQIFIPFTFWLLRFYIFSCVS